MIVITGGTGRLGSELTKLFKADQKTVVSIAKNENNAADYNLTGDLSAAKEVINIAEKVKQMDEPLEALINAAGFYAGQALGEMTEEGMRLNMALHAEAPMLLASNLIDKIKRDGTDIVNISSMAAVNPSTGAPAYGASKSALRGFSADLRLALKQYPSRVITLCPAPFGTKPEDGMNVGDVARFIKQLLDLPKDMEVSEVIINKKDVK